MADYGISTSSLPMFLGSECVVEHVKTLRLQYKNIQHDPAIHVDSATNNITEVKKIEQEKGWIDISNSILNLNDLFAFIGVQDYYSVKTSVVISESPMVIKPIKFRHLNGKTQARVAIESPLHWIVKGHNPDGFVEIFFYHRASELRPDNGYGVHIYNEQGRLRYKSGLKLLNNIRVLPVNFKHVTLTSQYSPFDINQNQTLRNPVGTNIAIMQTCNFIWTRCRKYNNRYGYGGGILTPYLTKDGKVDFATATSFNIAGHKRNYPSYANGGEYVDNIETVSQILIIDKPSY